MQPTLYLFVGYPGAGKTTVAKMIHELTGGIHLWTDQERKRMFANSTFSAEESAQLYSRLNQAAEYLLGQGKSVIFDTNFNYRRDRDHLRNLAEKHGATTKLIWLTTPRELAYDRASGESSNGHTRVYGKMASNDFERIAGNLEPPAEDENALKIDGTAVSVEQLKQVLGL